jgi:PAS domain S-box-containing protein
VIPEPYGDKVLDDNEVRIKAMSRLLKKTSEELDENLYYLEQFKRAVDDASILSTTDENGIITYANENFQNISGYSSQELIGRPHSIVRHPEVESRIYKDLWRTIKQGKIWNGMIMNRAKDGRNYHVVSEIAPIFYKDGTIKEYIGIRNDVTELEEYKLALKHELNSSQSTLDKNVNYIRQYEEAINLTTAVVKTDTNNVVTFANRRFLRLSGYRIDEVIGHNCEMFRHKKHRESGTCDRILKELANKKVVKETMTNMTKYGREFITNTLFYPLTDVDGNVIEYVQVMYDVTDIYRLNEEISLTQKEIVEKMGAIGETRSKETGDHVKRVAEYSYLLAKLYGLSEEEAVTLKEASPMHDIGKVGIPDEILNKPGKLTPEEFTIMKTHAEIGYEMLKHSERDLLQASAIVAYTHHEKWDGSGYPQGTGGEDIHIFGRITAVADVFDALGHDRVYKKAWELDRIYELFRDQRGIHFDPELVDIFFDNLDQFLAIKTEYDTRVS